MRDPCDPQPWAKAKKLCPCCRPARTTGMLASSQAAPTQHSTRAGGGVHSHRLRSSANPGPHHQEHYRLGETLVCHHLHNYSHSNRPRHNWACTPQHLQILDTLLIQWIHTPPPPDEPINRASGSDTSNTPPRRQHTHCTRHTPSHLEQRRSHQGATLRNPLTRPAN
jgi:hypothetical protein